MRQTTERNEHVRRGTRHAGTTAIIVCAALVLTQVLCPAATFTASNRIDYAGSSTDTLANMYPHGPSNYRTFYEDLTDGAMQGGEWTYSDPDTWTFAYDVPGTDTYVTHLDIWVAAGDGSRDSYNFEILFSDDGVNFTSLIQGTQNPSSESGKSNLARFDFDPEETRGMSHVRIISRGNSNQPRMGEIDLFTEPAIRDYSVSYIQGTNLNQSASDKINGIAPTVSPSFYAGGDGNGTLSDATSATEPTTTVFLFDDYVVATSRWDMGVIDPKKILDRVDIWLPTTDTSFRYPMRFRILVSPDGSSWQEVAETGPRAGTTAPGNLIRIEIEADTIDNLRYFGLADYPGIKSGRHGKIREVDVFITDPPPRGTVMTVK